MKTRIEFRSAAIGLILGLLLAVTIAAAVGPGVVEKYEYRKTPSGKPFEEIGRDKNGDIASWRLWFNDYEDKHRLQIGKDATGAITRIDVMSYNVDGNVVERYWFNGDGQLWRGYFYRYDEDGSFKETLIKDENGKDRGRMLTKDEGYMYGEKRKKVQKRSE